MATLLDAGSVIDARNSVLWTPLDCASAAGWLDTVTLLLENDAPVDAFDKTQTTPLHLACSKGHAPVNYFLFICKKQK